MDQSEISSKQDIYSQLRGENISDREYTEVIEMWQAVKSASLCDYMKVYLLIVTLLLAEILKNFREPMVRDHTLVEAAIYEGKTKLELEKDVDLLNMIVQIRAGVCYAYQSVNIDK